MVIGYFQSMGSMMEFVSLLIIIILFTLASIAYKKVIIEPRRKQELFIKKVFDWFMSFDKLDEIKNRDERSAALFELLIERRILINEVKGNPYLTELITDVTL